MIRTWSRLDRSLLLLCFRIFYSVTSQSFFVGNTKDEYGMASSYCPLGYELAILDDENITIAGNNILDLNGVGGHVWFSLSFVNGLFRWHDGTSMGNWTFWQSGEPDSDPVGNNVLCVSIDTAKNYQWESQSCTKDNRVLCYGMTVSTQTYSETTTNEALTTAGITTVPTTITPVPGFSLCGFVRTHWDEKLVDTNLTFALRSKLMCAAECAVNVCSAFAFSTAGTCEIFIQYSTQSITTVAEAGTSIWQRL